MMNKYILSCSFDEGNVKKDQYNHHQTKSNQRFYIGIKNIKFFIHSILSINAATRQTIAAQMSNVNTITFLKPFSLEKFGTIKTTPSHPAERLMRRSEIVARNVCIC